MIRVPGKAAIALLQALSAAFVVSSRDGHAQDRPADRAQSTAVQAARGQNPPGIRAAMHPGRPLRVTVSPCKDNVTLCQPQYTFGEVVRRTMLQETRRAAATDGASTSDVFLATALTAHLTHIVGYVFFGAAAYGTESESTAQLLLLSGAGLAWLGTLLPAAIMWRNFGGSLAGSTLGVVLGPLVGVGLGKAGVPFLPAYSLGALVHAGAITLVAAAGR